MKLSVPYERIIAGIAGPLAGAVGFGVTELVDHCGVLSTLAAGHNADISKAIVESTTFAVTAGVTFAAHHKWLDNLAAWWGSDGGRIEARVQAGVATIDPSASAVVAGGIGDINAIVNEILGDEAAQTKIQAMPGKDPSTVQHVGAETTTSVPGV